MRDRVVAFIIPRPKPRRFGLAYPSLGFDRGGGNDEDPLSTNPPVHPVDRNYYRTRANGLYTIELAELRISYFFVGLFRKHHILQMGGRNQHTRDELVCRAWYISIIAPPCLFVCFFLFCVLLTRLAKWSFSTFLLVVLTAHVFICP